MAITLDSIQADLHSIKISDGSNDLAIDASGFITANINGSVTVTATDLDIRDLSASQDNVAISDGTDTLAVNADGSINSVVTATDLDVRDLTHVSDSIKVGDGTEFLAINADGSINVNTVVDNISTWQYSAATVTNTAGELAATPFAGRDKMIIQNLGSQDVYLGDDNAVTTATGIKLPKGSSMELNFEEDANVFAITASGTADVRIGEFAA